MRSDNQRAKGGFHLLFPELGPLPKPKRADGRRPVRNEAHTAEARPTALRVIPKNIPKLLRSATRWVLWRYERRDSKWTKVPHQTDGRHASSTGPKTWASYESTLKTYRAGGYDGIGF